MRIRAGLIPTIMVAILVAGCGRADEKGATMDRSTSATQPSAAPQASEGAPLEMSNLPPPSEAQDAAEYISSSAAVEAGSDTSRRFIRTADLKFKVKSVIKATYAIEDIAARARGYVTYTNLNSVIDNRTITVVSADSSLETTYYTVSNQMVLRVPNTALDSTLKAIAAHIDYLDHRIIKADNVALQTLANDLARKRLARHQGRVTGAIDSRGRTLDETTTAEESVLNRQAESDAALLSNLSLKDQIEYSTITLAIYQRQSIARELFANDRNIDEYEPGIGTRLLEALEIGWKAFLSVIIALTEFWALILLIVIGYIVLRKYRRILMRRDRPDQDR